MRVGGCGGGERRQAAEAAVAGRRRLSAAGGPPSPPTDHRGGVRSTCGTHRDALRQAERGKREQAQACRPHLERGDVQGRRGSREGCGEAAASAVDVAGFRAYLAPSMPLPLAAALPLPPARALFEMTLLPSFHVSCGTNA